MYYYILHIGTILTTKTTLIKQFNDLCPVCAKELMILLKINLIGYLRIKLMTSSIKTYAQAH